MIRAIIAESEGHTLKRIKKLLGAVPGVQIIGETLEGDIAPAIVEGLKPDLLFLGIPAPGNTSAGIIESFTYWPATVFSLAYQPHLVKVFEQNSVDYLLKPFSQERFQKTVQRALQRAQRINERLREIFQAAIRQSNYLNHFAVRTEDGTMIIPAGKVHFFRAQEGGVYLHTFDNQYRFDMALRALEESLDPRFFCRIHRDHFVYLQRIKKITRNFRGQRRVILSDLQETRLPLAPEYFRGLKEKLNK